MTQDEFELVVSQGKRSVFENFLAALFFTGAILLLGLTLYSAFIDKDLGGFIVNLYRTLGIGLFSFGTGLNYAIIKTVLIDTDKDKLISRYSVGPFSYDGFSAIPNLEYVAVFFDSKKIFEVNLWYRGNKHYNMFCFDEKVPAFKFAEMVAEKLKLDLLDATEKGNFKWIEDIKA